MAVTRSASSGRPLDASTTRRKSHASVGGKPAGQNRVDHAPTPGQGRPADGGKAAASPTLGGHPTMRNQQLIDLFVTWLAAAGAGRDTIRVRRRHLVDLASEHPDLAAVTTADLAAWLAAHPWGHSARQQARASVRMFYGWLVDEAVIGSSPAARLPRVRHPRPTSRPAPLAVIAAALLRAQPREQRMILVARYAGLRRAEVAALHSDDLTDLGGGQRAVVVRGKGEHERVVPLHPAVAAALEGLDGYLFPSDRHPTGHLDPDTVGRYVSGLLGPGWSMHSLRHRAANDWLAVSGDIVAVQELLGHASINTTRIYLQPRQHVMVAAVLGVA